MVYHGISYCVVLRITVAHRMVYEFMVPASVLWRMMLYCITLGDCKHVLDCDIKCYNTVYCVMLWCMLKPYGVSDYGLYMLCRAIWCYTVLCHTMLHHTILCYLLSHRIMLHYTIMSYIISYYNILYYVLRCLAMISYTTTYLTML